LKIFAVAVACVAGLTAAAGVLDSAISAAAPALADNLFMLVPTASD
jgi:hypothetical protein